MVMEAIWLSIQANYEQSDRLAFFVLARHDNEKSRASAILLQDITPLKIIATHLKIFLSWILKPIQEVLLVLLHRLMSVNIQVQRPLVATEKIHQLITHSLDLAGSQTPRSIKYKTAPSWELIGDLAQSSSGIDRG